jgi:hypothetical protein
MAGPFNRVDYEIFVEAEASYNDITATPSAGDAIRTRTAYPFKRLKSRLDRDQELDGSSSVHGTVGGKEKASWEIEAAITPSGVTATPTPPDMFELFKAHFGVQDIGVAHSTTTAGSTTTVIAGTAGAVAAMGLVVGDFIGVEAPAGNLTLGVEYRQVTVIATDNITVTPALSFAPASGRALYATVTYKLSRTSASSVVIYSYLNGDNLRQMLPGALVTDMEVSLDASSDVPEAMVKFSGEGAKIIPLTTAKPTGTFAGEPMTPIASIGWIGATRICWTSLTLTSNNALEVRNNESCTLFPSGLKRTGNNGKYDINLSMELLALTGAIEGHYDVADDLTAYDVTVQFNNVLGKSCGFRAPSWRPDVDRGEVDGEVTQTYSSRLYSNNGVNDSELTFFFG